MKKHKLGDAHKIQGIPCMVRFVNAGRAWLFPLEDEQLNNGEFIMRCSAIAKLDARGKITLIYRIPEQARLESSAV